MPYQNVPDSLQDEMERCVKKVSETESEDAAIAICYASVVEGKANAVKTAAHYRYSAPVLQNVERKAITDAPNLRAANAQCCGNCKFWQWLKEADGICTKFQFEADCEYVCDAYENTFAAEVPAQIDAESAGSAADAGDMGDMNENADEMKFAVKFIGEGKTRIRAYAAMWGDAEHPDLSPQKDFFTPQTDFWDSVLSLPRPLTYHHGFEAQTKAQPIIGKIDKLGEDEIGKWYEAELDKAHKYYSAIRKLIEHGALKSSSDSVPQYVQRVPQSNGTNWLKSWALFGVTLTPSPAEPRMYAAAEIKSLYENLGVDLQLPEATAEANTVRAGAASASKTQDKTIHQVKTSPEANQMTEQEILALLETREKQQAEAKAKAEAEQKRIDELAEAKAQAKLAEMAKQNRAPIFAEGKTRVALATKYDDMSAADLAFLATLRNEAKSINRSAGADEALLRALALKSIKAVEQGKLEAKALEDLFPTLDTAAKSNEVMQSTLASYGDEWVPTNFSSQLWLKIRDESRLVQRIPQQEIPKGYESDTIPLESTDFSFYNVSQVASEDSTMKTPVATITSSKMGTAQRVITIGKLGARGEISGELDEDSIIDAIPEARRKLEAQLPVEMEFILLNADDTAATSNINGNGTPTSGADYTLWKGLMVLGLSTNTANKYDMGAAITSNKIAAWYATLGDNGLYVYQNPGACMVVVDGKSWLTKVWTLSDLLTAANVGEQLATISRGVDANNGIPIFGVPWYPSAGVKLAQATGIRHSATNAEDGSDTLGRAVLVRPDLWKMRWKRRAKFETTRIARSDLTELVVTMRFGLGYFDTDASSVAYNI